MFGGGCYEVTVHGVTMKEKCLSYGSRSRVHGCDDKWCK